MQPRRATDMPERALSSEILSFHVSGFFAGSAPGVWDPTSMPHLLHAHHLHDQRLYTR